MVVCGGKLYRDNVVMLPRLVDPELLAFVPQPVLAVLMLFPVTDLMDKKKDIENKEIEADESKRAFGSDLLYFKQTIGKFTCLLCNQFSIFFNKGNACGTIGLLHVCVQSRPRQCSYQTFKALANAKVDIRRLFTL